MLTYGCASMQMTSKMARTTDFSPTSHDSVQRHWLRLRADYILSSPDYSYRAHAAYGIDTLSKSVDPVIPTSSAFPFWMCCLE
jgi:hypothetical protein